MKEMKNDKYYIEKTIDELEFVFESMLNVSKIEFETNKILERAMEFTLIQISENTKNISDDFKEKYPEIPWYEIMGIRNRIVHDYGSVKLSVVYTTIKNDIPILLKILKENIND